MIGQGGFRDNSQRVGFRYLHDLPMVKTPSAWKGYITVTVTVTDTVTVTVMAMVGDPSHNPNLDPNPNPEPNPEPNPTEERGLWRG